MIFTRQIRRLLLPSIILALLANVTNLPILANDPSIGISPISKEEIPVSTLAKTFFPLAADYAECISGSWRYLSDYSPGNSALAAKCNQTVELLRTKFHAMKKGSAGLESNKTVVSVILNAQMALNSYEQTKHLKEQTKESKDEKAAQDAYLKFCDNYAGLQHAMYVLCNSGSSGSLTQATKVSASDKPTRNGLFLIEATAIQYDIGEASRLIQKYGDCKGKSTVLGEQFDNVLRQQHASLQILQQLAGSDSQLKPILEQIKVYADEDESFMRQTKSWIEHPTEVSTFRARHMRTKKIGETVEALRKSLINDSSPR
jgi:hypothetical protein